jgi:amidase
MIRFLSLLIVFISLLSTSGCALLSVISGSCALKDGVYPKSEPDYNAKRSRNLEPFAEALTTFSADRAAELDSLLQNKSILDIQDMLESGDLSSEELVTYYVDRIERYDIDRLNSVMELNPEALSIARALDEERGSGNIRGDMHGIPVLLKDNIATGDGLHAAAGAVALAEWQPDRDAFLVQQLRDNGAIILGKANLSEWANWMDSCMPNGFSALGGQTQNPHGPYDPSGSSSGSAVAAAANLSTVTVGSETQGSMIWPARDNGVVALKTSMGLVSRDYIIPLLPFQDVPGPIARSVTDAAVLLSAMSGSDANDPATADAAELAGTDFTQFLNPQAIDGLKVGITITPQEQIQALKEQAAEGTKGLEESIASFETQNENARALGAVLAEAGIEVIEVAASDVPFHGDVEPLLTHGYKLAINEFLAGLGDQVAVSSLDEIVSFNNDDLENRAPYGQDHLEDSLESALSDEEYGTMREAIITDAQQGFADLFEKYDIDVIINNRTQAYAHAGYPALTIPAGIDASGMPVGTVLIAGYLGEPALIAAGYALEQGSPGRVEPDLEATMDLIEALSE